jgi:hypothetical protein
MHASIRSSQGERGGWAETLSSRFAPPVNAVHAGRHAELLRASANARMPSTRIDPTSASRPGLGSAPEGHARRPPFSRRGNVDFRTDVPVRQGRTDSGHSRWCAAYGA